jgi:hypothetical protein
MKAYKLHSKIGPGGLRCPCCSFGTPSEVKKKINRKNRRAARKAGYGDES